MITLGKLAVMLKREFKPPFLPKGFVKVKETYTHKAGEAEPEPILLIQIGDREVEIDKNGRWLSSGSNVGEGIKWKIEKIKK